MQQDTKQLQGTGQFPSIWWLAILLLTFACSDGGWTFDCNAQYDSASAGLDRAIVRFAEASIVPYEIFDWTTIRECGDDSLTVSRDFKLIFPQDEERCFTGFYTVILEDGPHMFTVDEAPCPD